MTDSLDRSFGLIIAFLLPGFIGLCGYSAFSPTLTVWLSAEPSIEPRLSGFLYVVLGSLAVGLIISAVRWGVIDTLHHATGLTRPDFDYRRLTDHLLAYQLAVEHNYRYFQFYANTAVANLWFFTCHQLAYGTWPLLAWLGFLTLEGILLIASRDALDRFYQRVALVLGLRETTSQPSDPQQHEEIPAENAPPVA